MLKNLDPILHADLLHALRSMGHGDEIAVVDAHFPAASCARRLIQLAGVDALRTVRAILTVLPIDDYAEFPAVRMQVVGDPAAEPEICIQFAALVSAAAGRQSHLGVLERHAFYERARGCYAIVTTGEERPYGNLILSKGVVSREERGS